VQQLDRTTRRHGPDCAGLRAAARVAFMFALALLAIPAPAEELAAYKGATDTDDHTSGSYSWQLEYRQLLDPLFDASFTYINEGHLPGHHRDGVSLQAWAVTPRWHQRFDFALGLGPYFYSDTQSDDSAAGFRDYHGVGEVLTGSFTYRWDSGWFARLNLAEIHTPGDTSTHTVVLGVGYSLDRLAQSLSGAFSGGATPFSHAELGAFMGQTIDNSLSSPRSGNLGVEFRQGIYQHFELSGSWISEADAAGHRDGLIGELWLVDPLTSHPASLGLGVGAYVPITQRPPTEGPAVSSAEGVVSITASWQFAKALVARITWTRDVTSDNHDRDIIILGLGWRWD
jgi:hypothetical protein